jgi:hypothetical protein
LDAVVELETASNDTGRDCSTDSSYEEGFTKPPLSESGILPSKPHEAREVCRPFGTEPFSGAREDDHGAINIPPVFKDSSTMRPPAGKETLNPTDSTNGENTERICQENTAKEEEPCSRPTDIGLFSADPSGIVSEAGSLFNLSEDTDTLSQDTIDALIDHFTTGGSKR